MGTTMIATSSLLGPQNPGGDLEPGPETTCPHNTPMKMDALTR